MLDSLPIMRLSYFSFKSVIVEHWTRWIWGFHSTVINFQSPFMDVLASTIDIVCNLWSIVYTLQEKRKIAGDRQIWKIFKNWAKIKAAAINQICAAAFASIIFGMFCWKRKFPKRRDWSHILKLFNHDGTYSSASTDLFRDFEAWGFHL